MKTKNNSLKKDIYRYLLATYNSSASRLHHRYGNCTLRLRVGKDGQRALKFFSTRDFLD